MRDSGTHRFEGLDGLRGTAALAVMFGHFGQILGSYWPPHFFLAVDIFFIMSGFVIAHSYGRRLRDGMSPWTYLRRRLDRLYPMFLAGLLLGAAALFYGASLGEIACPQDRILLGIALNAFYIPFLNAQHIYQDVGQIFPADPPAWSLFLEMLASGGFLLLFARRRTTLLLMVASSYLALALTGFFFARAHGAVGFDVSNGYNAENMLGGLPRVAFGFMLGMLLYSLPQGGAAERFAATLGRWVRYPSFLLYAAVLAVFVWPFAVRGVYALAVLATVAPALVLWAARLRTRPGLETRIAWFLGWISYPVYCLHVPIVRWVIFLRHGAHSPAWLVIATGATATLASAMLLTRFYEEPLRWALSLRQPLRAGVALPLK